MKKRSVHFNWLDTGRKVILYAMGSQLSKGRDGTQVCIDSTHEYSRQMYVIDVSEIVGA